MTIVFEEMQRDVQSPEGPVWLGNGEWLVTEMGRGTIIRVSETTRTTLATTGRPNGLAVDDDGSVWIAESLNPAILALNPSAGEVTEILTRRSHGLMWPNDLCFAPDGALWFTDSGITLSVFEAAVDAGDFANADIDGRLIRFDPVSHTMTVEDHGLHFANGIAVHPSGDAIFVAETLTGSIYRYTLDGAVLGSRELYCNVMSEIQSPSRGVAGPDGMAFSAEGELCVCVLAQSDVTVVASGGTVHERWTVDDGFPTNITFGGEDRSTILVTAAHTNRLLVAETPYIGAALFTPPAWSHYRNGP
ncbi:MAG: SMP-30/gluconolactonase/LRE family protein [Actinomycetia bacterium]|nr:SMP-30/gluconolactonase/LRE family protein [Actinomycetes bacterium]